jgi:hypothetical protein
VRDGEEGRQALKAARGDEGVRDGEEEATAMKAMRAIDGQCYLVLRREHRSVCKVSLSQEHDSLARGPIHDVESLSK